MNTWSERVENLADYWHMHVMEVLGGWRNWDESGDVASYADPIRSQIRGFAAPADGAAGAAAAIETLSQVKGVLSEANQRLADAKDNLVAGDWTGAAADQFKAHINDCTAANELFGDVHVEMLRVTVDAYRALVQGMTEELLALSKQTMDALAGAVAAGGINIDVGRVIVDGLKGAATGGAANGALQALESLLTDVAIDVVNELLFANAEEEAVLEDFKKLLARLSRVTEEGARCVGAGFRHVQEEINSAKAMHQIDPGPPEVVTRKRFDPADFIPGRYSEETKPAEQRGDEKIPAEREVKPEYRDRIKVPHGELIPAEKRAELEPDRAPADAPAAPGGPGPGVGTAPLRR